MKNSLDVKELLENRQPALPHMVTDFRRILAQALLGITCNMVFPNVAGFLVAAVLVGAAQYKMELVA